MAIDEADSADASEFSEADASETQSEVTDEPTEGSSVRVGDYTWADFMAEYGYEDEVSTLYPHGTDAQDDQLGLDADGRAAVPRGDDWDRVSFDPEAYLGYHPDELSELITETLAPNATVLWEEFLDYVDPETTPVTKDVYSWEHYKWEYYYDDDGSRPTSGGEVDPFDESEALGFDPDDVEWLLHEGGNAAMELDDVVEERTVNVNEDVDEDEFFSTVDGHTTVVNRYDLEKAVPLEKKQHFIEEERYWVNKPYAFVIIFHSEKENEKKYYLIEPYCTEIESELQEFLSGKLRTAIKYSQDGVKSIADEDGRRDVIEQETRRLLKRYDLFEKTGGSTTKSLVQSLRELLDDDDDEADDVEPTAGQLEGLQVRPEPIIVEEDPDTLSEYQVEKLLYLLKRDFIGYERIDGIKHDINVEDISVDGYNSPVFVYHSEYEQIISNIYHGKEELDDFVVKLAQRSGKGISKRLPQVDATLPDGSRAQLTLGSEVSDHGTNYTIRQFKDVPFTPVDLINWNTFSLDEMAFLWLCIENHKSLIFAGGTASGKTTSLNAVSLFIPSNTKIVSIEDTREVELPQRNWIASMTRPSFSDDSQGDIDEFDLLEAALRQRPDYIVMGEIRGEEGRTLFQVMSTGHTTYTTFHADSVDEVLKRFTTDPINVSKTMFTALDLVSIQTQTRVQGRKVRRNKSLTEINHYEAEHDEINVQDVYQWQAETDEYLKMGDSNTLDEIKFDRGWKHEKLQDELFKRRVILAYLIKNELNTYAEVAATVQAFINDPDTILTLIANDQLENSLDDLREMESVLIDVDQEKEELVPRPDPTSETYNLATDILERAEESLFEEYRGKVPSGLAGALGDVESADPIDVTDDGFDLEEPAPGAAFEPAGGDAEPEWESDDGPAEFGFDASAETPSWLDSEDSVDDEAPETVEADAGADLQPADSPVPDTTTGTESEAAPDEEDSVLAKAPELDSAGGDVESPDSPSESQSSPPASTPGTGSQSEPSPAEPDSSSADAAETGAESEEDPEQAFDELFSDMGSTLAELEDEAADAAASESTDGSDEAPFGDRDFDSIFDDAAETPPSENEGSTAENEPSTTADTSAEASTETTSGGSTDRPSPDADHDADGGDPDLQFDESATADRDDEASAETEPASSPVSDSDPADAELTSGSEHSTPDTEDVPAADDETEWSPDEESTDDSIFGDESGSVFSDDGDDADDEEDEGFLFGSDADDDDGGDSIFGDERDDGDDDGDDSRSIFGDSGEDET